mmetsp:Transcript_87022/g.182147  ORF Transcript_87022/g.182147 Transcript_87022/m.182147 type:complete len:376 (+) Transcript_87022:970-2097(+)
MNDGFWRAVLPGLDLVGEVAIHPAGVAQVGNFVGDAWVVEKVQAHHVFQELHIRVGGGGLTLPRSTLFAVLAEGSGGDLEGLVGIVEAIRQPHHGCVVSIGREQGGVGARGFQQRLHVWRAALACHFWETYWSSCPGIVGGDDGGRRFLWLCNLLLAALGAALGALLLHVFLTRLLLPAALLGLVCFLGCLLLRQLLVRCRLGSMHGADQRDTLLVHGDTSRAAHEHVFGLEIRVDDTANTMEIVQTNQSVGDNLADDVERNSLEVVALNECQNIGTHGLEYHAHVLSMRSIMFKIVHELHHACEGQLREQVLERPPLCRLPVQECAPFRCFCQESNLIVGCFRVVGGTFLHLHRYMGQGLLIMAQPHRREVTPS